MKHKLCFALLTALALAPSISAAQQAYPNPDAAFGELANALAAAKPDEALFAKMFGSTWREFVPVGTVDKIDIAAFRARYGQRHEVEYPKPDVAILSVGTDPWTLPVPMKKAADGWHFDIVAGAEEARVRRIGRNELTAIQSVLAYDDAQNDYAAIDRDGDGVLEYAQKLLSTDGLHDGLYWSDDDSGEISPLGPLFGDAEPGGDWHGYHFRILAKQGPSAFGGAYPYRIGDNMSRGFALLAWPDAYGDSGVMSFMVSHEGKIFQKDLGAKSAAVAAKIDSFDPDTSWEELKDVPKADPTP